MVELSDVALETDEFPAPSIGVVEVEFLSSLVEDSVESLVVDTVGPVMGDSVNPVVVGTVGAVVVDTVGPAVVDTVGPVVEDSALSAAVLLVEVSFSLIGVSVTNGMVVELSGLFVVD